MAQAGFDSPKMPEQKRAAGKAETVTKTLGGHRIKDKKLCKESDW